MKNPIKKIALLMAAIMCASVMATAVSAKSIFVSVPDDADVNETETEISKEDDCKVEDDCEEKKDIIMTADEYKQYIYEESLKYWYDKVWCKPSIIKPCPIKPVPGKPVIDGICGSIISGGKYFDTVNAKAELEKYFKANSSKFYMTVGEARSFCEDAYFYSTDTDVVSYNYTTEKLEARGYGSASVYVYTEGGIPYYRIDVLVGRGYSPNNFMALTVTPDDKKIEIGDCVEFTAVNPYGVVYDDIVYSIKNDTKAAHFDPLTGKLVADGSGAVVVHAERESDPSVYGDCIVYIGSYRCAVVSDGWNNCDGGIFVDKWYSGICGGNVGKPCGWIKCANGVLVPVLVVDKGYVVQEDGSLKETTIVTSGFAPHYGFIKEWYPTHTDFLTAVIKYNLMKYGMTWDCDNISYWDVDYRNFMLSMMIKDIID